MKPHPLNTRQHLATPTNRPRPQPHTFNNCIPFLHFSCSSSSSSSDCSNEGLLISLYILLDSATVQSLLMRTGDDISCNIFRSSTRGWLSDTCKYTSVYRERRKSIHNNVTVKNAVMIVSKYANF